jgi:predicted transcriptional regulator
METVIISLHEKWWHKMTAGEKLLEIRKTKPTIDGAYKVLVYITGTGCIYGQFICPEVLDVKNYEEIVDKSNVSLNELHEYGKGKMLAGWKIENVIEYNTPHPLRLYGMERPPQAWCYYRGNQVPDLMNINNYASVCGFFTGDSKKRVNGVQCMDYKCNHPENVEPLPGYMICEPWTCPLSVQATEEDCERYGVEYQEFEFVLVNRG